MAVDCEGASQAEEMGSSGPRAANSKLPGTGTGTGTRTEGEPYLGCCRRLTPRITRSVSGLTTRRSAAQGPRWATDLDGLGDGSGGSWGGRRANRPPLTGEVIGRRLAAEASHALCARSTGLVYVGLRRIAGARGSRGSLKLWPEEGHSWWRGGGSINGCGELRRGAVQSH